MIWIARFMAISFIAFTLLDALLWWSGGNVMPNSFCHQLIGDWNWISLTGAWSGWWTIGRIDE